jgi:hypothetical protein
VPNPSILILLNPFVLSLFIPLNLPTLFHLPNQFIPLNLFHPLNQFIPLNLFHPLNQFIPLNLFHPLNQFIPLNPFRLLNQFILLLFILLTQFTLHHLIPRARVT